MDEILCEFFKYVGIDCQKEATYTYRDDGIVFHFCKEHYGVLTEDENEDE
jgi:hypothetical protein